MPGDELDAARDWWRRALRDLSGTRLAGQEPEHRCFLAQQAAEKAMKAVLVLNAIDFPFSHDLRSLSRLLPENFRTELNEDRLAELAAWAVSARYPTDLPLPTSATADRATETATATIEALRAAIRATGTELDA